MRINVFIHHEGAGYWSEVRELPGCFASGRTLSELHDALGEAVGLYLWDEPATVEEVDLQSGPLELTIRPHTPHGA
jgi:predicted RNase H-like HicB family nuclease